MKWTEKEAAVLTALQCGIEPLERPFRGFILPEHEVVALLQRAQAEGVVRRFGGVFDARRLGYQSLLCALAVETPRLEEMAAVIVRHPGVTHCYERRSLNDADRCPGLWFTFAMQRDAFDAGLKALRADLEGAPLLLLPALRRFKIDVVFDLRQGTQGALPRDARSLPEPLPDGVPLSVSERRLVRMLDQQVAVSARPFDGIAQRLGLPVQDVLAMLRRWKRLGVMRRLAAVLYHREAGFTVNAMCVWPVQGEVGAAGRRVAARPEVTHCYQRPRLDAFPFDLYAMVHTAGRPEAVTLYEQISAESALPAGRLLVSTREFKKTSMRYFLADGDA